VRTSTIVLIILHTSCACATSQEIDAAALKAGPSDTSTNDGAVAGPPQDGSGGFDTSSGGFPSNGGLPATGGAHSTGGTPGAGGGRNGGSPGTGGFVGSGGTGPTGGSSNGGSVSAGGCTGGQKLCNGACVSPGPANGCSLTGCTPCAASAPAHGVLSCKQEQCDFQCQSGFNRTGSSCVAPPVYCQPQDAGADAGPCTNSCPLSGSTQCCTGRKQCGCTANLVAILCL
jgi:hypothetical protein